MVKVGQVYKDNDSRMGDRHVLVDEVRDGRARCFYARPDGTLPFGYGRSTRISVINLEKRFRLIKDMESEDA